MKWQNKGHEFDELAKVILEPNKKYYIWGAAVGGRGFYSSYKDEFEILGFIDSDEGKWGQKIDGVEIYPPSQLKDVSSDTRVVIATVWTTQVFHSLSQMGFVENVNCFTETTMVTTYMLYKYNKSSLPAVSYAVTRRCTLKCKHCLAYVPYLKSPQDVSVDDILNDLDLFFRQVDHLSTILLTGGDPFLHKGLDLLIEEIATRYLGRQLGQITVLTSGVIVPNDTLIDIFKKYDVIIRTTNYVGASNRQRLEELGALFDSHQIRFEVINHPYWVDVGYPQENNGTTTEREWIEVMDKCDRACSFISKGRLARCGAVFHAESVDYCPPHEGDYIDLRTHNPENKKEFIEFMSGYSHRGYVELCKKCNGFINSNPKIVPVGEQLP